MREAINKGLPKSAIEIIEPIIAGAMTDKACGEAIKAIGGFPAGHRAITSWKSSEVVETMKIERKGSHDKTGDRL